MTNNKKLQEALVYLAGRCDHAFERDNVGFNAYDAPLGHALAGLACDDWTTNQARAAYRVVKRYSRQLEAGGFDVEAFQPPSEQAVKKPVSPTGHKPRKDAKAKTVVLYNDYISIVFPYDPDLVHEVRGIPGRKWDKVDKMWTLPRTFDGATLAIKFAEKYGFNVDPELRAWADSAKARAEAAVEASRAADTDFQVDGLGAKLYPFQRAGVKYAVETERAFIADEMGCISGDSVIQFKRGHTIFRMPIEEACTHFQGLENAWDKEVPTKARALVSGKIKFHQVLNILDKGVDRTLLLRFVSGKSIRLTADHKLRTLRGWREAGWLGAGDTVIGSNRKGDSFVPVIETVATIEQAKPCHVYDMVMESPHHNFVANGLIVHNCGKTVQALAYVQALEDYPSLFIVPASVKYNWAREAKKWLPGRSVQIVNGYKPQRIWADVVIINYDILGRHVERLQARKFRAIVLDESTYAKSPTAMRTKHCLTLSKDIPHRLCLTGTPVLNRPEELVAQLDFLGRIQEFGGKWQFYNRYCQNHHNGWGWVHNGAANLDELHRKLRESCYVRRTKEQVLKDLPPRQRTTIEIEIDNRKEYNLAEKNLIRWILELEQEDETFLESIADLPDEEQMEAKRARRRDAAQRALRAEKLVRIGKLKQIAARGKLNSVKDWVEDFLASGEKLVLFAHHKAVVRELAKTFDAPAISGDTSLVKRQEIIDRFQTDPACQIVVCNIRAGGMGITLTAASNVAFVELDWTPAAHDQAEARVHRIGQKANSVNAWYLLGRGTIDYTIARLIEEKRAVVNTVTDGGTSSGTASILNDLVEELKGKGRSK